MVRKRLLSRVFATVMALTMIFAPTNGITVQAAENEVSQIASRDIFSEESSQEVISEEDIKYQEPVLINDFDVVDNTLPSRLTGTIQIEAAEIRDIPMTTDDSTVVAGTVSDYLEAEGDALIYNINLVEGIYFQAQLTPPANANLDYDLYLLDANGEVLVGSDYYTLMNGADGTLQESIGFFPEGEEATYYIYVLASKGGSINQPFTLDYSLSIAYDRLEPNESVREAKAFTFDSNGATIDYCTLSSPIDNDWYEITIPENRIYNRLNISAATASSNTCSVEVYQNIASEGYKMQKVGNGGSVAVSTGTYYVRVSNAKSMDEYNDLDIQNYTLTITPILSATNITITSLSGTEGSKYVTYSGYGNHFRTSTGTVTVSGYATIKDPETNTTYYATNTPVTVMYYNPYWEENNTPDYAYVYAHGTTDSTGKYTIRVSLPNPTSSCSADTGVSYHYFDVCAIYALASDNTSVNTYEVIFHYSYSIYHG